MRPAQLILFVAVLLSAGCDTLGSTELEPEVVVEAYLVAGAPMGTVRLTRTVAVEEIFDADALALEGADVRIERFSRDGGVDAVYAFDPSPGKAGVYAPRDPPVVEPLRTYRLVVQAPGFADIVTSTTTVPGTFVVLSVNRDTVVYRSDTPLTVHLSRPFYPNRQSFFVLTTSALEASVSNLTPFAKARYEDGDVTVAKLRENVSPLLNEESFDPSDDGTLRVQYPWLGVNFYGRNRVTLQALDDNFYDFLRSQSVQQGGSTLPPGEIPNVLDRIEGGRGLFGSFARASVEFVVLKQSGP